MKKLIVIFFLLFLCLPQITNAAGLVPCGGSDDLSTPTINESLPCTACDLLILFQNVLKKALEIAFLIVIGSIVYGGFRWIFSLGKEENLKAGQKIITNAIIGIVIILTAWLIVNTVFWVIKQMGGDDYTGTWFHINCSELSGWNDQGGETPVSEDDQGGETPASEQETEPVSKCSDCGKGVLARCTELECLSLGNCKWQKNSLIIQWALWWFGTCQNNQ